MVVNYVIGAVLLIAGLAYWKGIGPALKKRREQKEKELERQTLQVENQRKREAYSAVLRFLSEEWISVEILLAKLAEADGMAVEEFFQPKMFDGLQYGIGFKYVEKSGLNYRLTKLGSQKKK